MGVLYPCVQDFILFNYQKTTITRFSNSDYKKDWLLGTNICMVIFVRDHYNLKCAQSVGKAFKDDSIFLGALTSVCVKYSTTFVWFWIGEIGHLCHCLELRK